MTWYQQGISEERNGHTTEVFTVSQVSALVQALLDDMRLQDIWIRGEITNLKIHGSGHRYFSLGEKSMDHSAVLSCVMWRNDAQRVNCELGDGMDVLVFGSIGHYAPQGRYQLYVRDIRPAGRGEKHLMVEQWKVQLAAEGCFDPLKKRPLPTFPSLVGVVTSETGAVLQDIRNVISRRYPLELVVSPTAVQGEGAHQEIAQALHRVEARVEVIILARGGGSFEDLFPFNHPDVVRAISACPVPVVSAIGHEVDVTLADFAADVRAPTPSAAAELVVPDRVSVLESLGESRKMMGNRLLARLDRAGADLCEVRERLSPRRIGQKVTARREDVSILSDRMIRGISSRIALERERLSAAAEILAARNPAHLLRKGYCILQKEGRVIRSVGETAPGDFLSLRLRDGEVDTRVERVYHDPEI
ncbi:MAG: exodeoxyribonuclease VII large subunit [Methanolinea sp.]|jgi:exodeoxyribonuclease VII large subunit|nr:exodeoxyribonuclease VII large subunit [Methanolinea sp.]